MKILGYTVIPVVIGNNIQEAKFTIVETIFPKVIIGMKLMRKMKIMIDAGKQCAVLNGSQIVPFISQVPPSEN